MRVNPLCLTEDRTRMQRPADREPGQNVAEVGAPRPTRLDLHGEVFGVPIRIHPLFWPAAAALGWGAYANPDQGSVAMLLLWVLCVTVSLLIHELAHVAVARMFGARLGIVL
jgi:stage IV sporulation protein FB